MLCLFPQPQIKLPAGSASPGVSAKEKGRESKGSCLMEWCPRSSADMILQNGACSPNLALFTNTMQLASLQYHHSRWAHGGNSIFIDGQIAVLRYIGHAIKKQREPCLKYGSTQRLAAQGSFLSRLSAPHKALLEQLRWLWMFKIYIPHLKACLALPGKPLE